MSESIQNILLALQEGLPGSELVGAALRVPLDGGSFRIVAVGHANNAVVDHALAFGFAPALGEPETLDACHLRARCRRSIDAIEAAQLIAEGKGGMDAARAFARESVEQIRQAWTGFLDPNAWLGPQVEDMLRVVANAAPADAEALLALVRGGAMGQLGHRVEARKWADVAAKATDERIVKAVSVLRSRLADA